MGERRSLKAALLLKTFSRSSMETGTEKLLVPPHLSGEGERTWK